ncbi:hypothetical protein K3553_02590 [Leisingera aquaemixtae]|uniref:hypothetical protein n=1 Tax=Leisingera aquaemixtae TaxID=1396826 RepID=UPI0021A6D15A|nr:hypothetical protein [Leisingera aquaemixtae]UWQ25375.1 hypothetical protein K3553_02590 [Leisingera aquaemixtae]
MAFVFEDRSWILSILVTATLAFSFAGIGFAYCTMPMSVATSETIELPKNTSVDVAKLSKAKSLKQLLAWAGKMRVGSTEDQQALSVAVNAHMMKCCKDYNDAMLEIKKAGFGVPRSILKNVRKNPEQFMVKETEFDQALYAEYAKLKWQAPERLNVGQILASIIPVSRQCRISLYFKNAVLVEATAVMHTDAF